MAELLFRTQGVGGSIPLVSSKKNIKGGFLMKNFGKIIVGFFAVIGALTVLEDVLAATCQVIGKKKYITSGEENIEDIIGEKTE